LHLLCGQQNFYTNWVRSIAYVLNEKY
jgi:hypothetical protein